MSTTVALPLLTNSRAKDFRACARLHQLRYERGYRPAVEASELRFGSLIHTGLEAWWRAPAAERWEAASAALTTADADALDRVKALVLLAGYHARWIDEPLDAIAVEHEFTVPLINPATGAASRTWTAGGKIDAIVRHRDSGRVYVVEHKTSSETLDPGSDYWRRLLLDSQVSTYMMAVRALGYEPAGTIYDVIAKPAQRPLLATPEDKRRYRKGDGALDARQRDRDETLDEYRDRITEAVSAEPERYFRRAEIVRLEEDERDAAFDLWQTGRAIADARNAGRWPRNPDACIRYSRACVFFDCCTRVASIDDPTRYRRVDPDHPNEELSGGPRAA